MTVSNRITEGARADLLFSLFLFAVLFSIQVPLPGLGSDYASLNASDFVLVGICALFVWSRIRSGNWAIKLVLPRETTWFLIVGAWILLTVAIAVIREPVSVLINFLWTLKWFEITVLLILSQIFIESVRWDRIMKLLLGGGALIGAVAALQSLTATAAYAQPTVFWSNPSTLSVFLSLPTLLGLLNGVLWFSERPVRAGVSLAAGLLCLFGLFVTGSRAGIVTLVIGCAVCVYLLRDKLPVRMLLSSIAGTLLIVSPLLSIFRPWIFDRYIPIAIRNGRMSINNTFFNGLEARYQLTKKGFELWTQQPVFGYGWFASPENPRVGFLDMLYSQLLVDVGIVGFVFVILFYLIIANRFVWCQTRWSRVIPAVGSGWLVGLLGAGIGGAHVRVPRIMFLLIILLVASISLKNRGEQTYWA